MHTFFNPVSILCFGDDGGDGGDGGDSGGGGDAAAAAAAAGASGGEKTFTQTDLNKILAEDKRKHQERYSALEGEHAQLLKNQNLTNEERDTLQSRLMDLQAEGRTKEQQAEYERKQSEEKYENELKEARKRADTWETKYKTETVHRALLDAASGGDAYNPGHIVALLAPNTELKDVDGHTQPMVDFADIDEKTGEEVRTLRTPVDAVKRMQELPKIHGCLFKSNVVSGVGAGQASVSGAGEVDYSTMTAEDYRKNRAAIKRRLDR